MLKKSIALILLLVMLLPNVCVFAEDSEELLGDVNDDGVIDQYDYILVKRYYFGTISLSPMQTLRADVNSDYVVDQYDYILISRHYFGTYTIKQPNQESGAPEIIPIPNIVSEGKSYTITPPPSSEYDDNRNNELTDGVYDVSASYSSGVYCGLNSDFEVVVDLADECEQLNRFEVSYLGVTSAGINAPLSIYVYGSDNQYNWQSVGKMTIPEFKEGTVQRAFLEIENDISFRYIKFEIAKKSAWVFIDEVFVYSSIPKYIENVVGKYESIYNATAPTDNVQSHNISSVASDKKFNSQLGMSVVSKGCDYSIECLEYDTRTDDNEGCLTNGNTVGSAFETDVWVGINNSQGSVITLDLGELRDDVCGFSLYAFKREASNVFLPYCVDVSVSNDGKSFVTVGRSYGIEADQENYEYRITLDKCINARYVRFTVSESNGFAWFEEVCVYANAQIEIEYEMMYGDFEFETTDVPSYWEEDDDYNKTQNLILGKPQQIVSDSYLEYTDSDPETSNTAETTKLLTDGKYTNDDYCYNGKWVHFVRGNGRSIYYDLGNISSVSSFSVRFLEFDEWAIAMPTVIKLALSENGKDWYLAATVTPQSRGDMIVTVTGDCDKEYRARYAMIYMDIGVHVFLDEITINGKKNHSSASSLDSLPEYKIYTGDYSDIGYAGPSEELLGGVNDICLIYHNGITTDESYFKPYVGYVDANGKIKDTLFDGYLFLPTTAPLPSGGRPYGTNYASDWNGLFDALFRNGINFDALNKTAETTKNTLGLDELKLKVYVAIPHMDDSLYYFGDIDLNGDNESLTTVEDRVYVAQTYAERIIEKFNSKGYQNLELCGFYWFHEEISGTDIETAKAVNKMFDEIGYQLFWIPYYNAGGYMRWEEFGFDVACYQPNYAFNIEVDEVRLKHASIAAKNYGMCIELEIDDAALYEDRFFRKYMNYLARGVDLGYMEEAIHMYYQSTNILGRASKLADKKTRLIYDYTYEFIKGTLDPSPEACDDIAFEAEVNKMLSGSVAKSNSLPTQYQLYSSPSHGTVTVTEEGEFVYYPNKNFKGTDSFTYRISHYLGWSEECTVTIEVE